jgi:hypothetical protein
VPSDKSGKEVRLVNCDKVLGDFGTFWYISLECSDLDGNDRWLPADDTRDVLSLCVTLPDISDSKSTFSSK